MNTSMKSGGFQGGRFIGHSIKWVFLIAVAFFTIFPIIMAILGSVKTNGTTNNNYNKTGNSISRFHLKGHHWS